MFFNSQINGDPASYVFLITGTDSGFGNIASIKLARMGYTVYAACYGEAGVKQLQSLQLKNLIPVKMDVTNQKDCELVFEKIKKEEGNLFCLINNAGLNDGY